MFKKLMTLAAIAAVFPVHAAVVEVGDLNVIDDTGNASNGLRFLDMTYSVGLTQGAALANAQAAYANARIATATEFDDLFAAAGILYTGVYTASSSFNTGSSQTLSSGSQYDGGQLMFQLGVTYTDPDYGFKSIHIFTDPDGSNDLNTTRDWLLLRETAVSNYNHSLSPTYYKAGWLIVSEVSEVPVPAAAWLFGSALIGLVGIKRKK